MKKYVIAAFFACLLAVGHSDDLELKNGTILKDYRIINHSAVDAMVIHEGGAETVELKDLPDELQKKYGYNKEDAEEYLKESQKKEKERAERLRAERAKREADRKLMEKAEPLELHVFQVYDGGLLVNNIEEGVVASSSASVGGGGNVHTFKKRGNKIFYVTGYPDNNIVDGARIDGMFIDSGSYSYTTTLGAPTTVKKYRFVKHLDKN